MFCMHDFSKYLVYFKGFLWQDLLMFLLHFVESSMLLIEYCIIQLKDAERIRKAWGKL
jgi:hypothetical protein